MQMIRNITISIGVCLIGLLFVACSGSLQSAQVSQATTEATAIESSATKRRTIKATTYSTYTPSMPRPTSTPRKPTNTIAPSPTLNTTPVTDLLGLPMTPITSPLSEQLQLPPTDRAWVRHDGGLYALTEEGPVRYSLPDMSLIAISPNGKYLISRVETIGFDIYDAERVRSYRISYAPSSFIFSDDSSQVAFTVYIDHANWSVLIVDLETGVLRQAFHSSQWPNYTDSKFFNPQEWNAAGLFTMISDYKVVGAYYGYELFDPDSLEFETIGSDYMWGASMSHNGRFVMLTKFRGVPEMHIDHDILDLLLIDRENNSEMLIDEGYLKLSGFSPDDRYFVYTHVPRYNDIHKDEDQTCYVRFLDMDTKVIKELKLGDTILQLGFCSVYWYGKEQLLLRVFDEDKMKYYLVPIKDFDREHLDLIATMPYTPPTDNFIRYLTEPQVLYLPQE